jgi:hypothetical protein
MTLSAKKTSLGVHFSLNFFFFFPALGLELRASTLSHSTSPFCEGFFERGSQELFAQAVFELRSS